MINLQRYELKLENLDVVAIDLVFRTRGGGSVVVMEDSGLEFENERRIERSLKLRRRTL